jgi:hypothetical protein
MGSLLPDDADDVSVSRRDAETLPDDDLIVPSIKRGEPEAGLLVDASDDEADLVDVSREQHLRSIRRTSRRLDPSERAPDDVVSDFIGECRRFFSPHLGRG